MFDSYKMKQARALQVHDPNVGSRKVQTVAAKMKLKLKKVLFVLARPGADSFLR